MALDGSPAGHLRPWLEEHVGIRGLMNAWEWESFLLSQIQLRDIVNVPCYDRLDDRLIILANDWIRLLRGIHNRELRSPTHQVAGREEYAFAKLYNLVYRLQDLVYSYYHGVPEVRRTPEQHETIWPGIPSSDVAQARFTIASLAQNGFGAWLEDIPMTGWTMHTTAMVFNFTFNPRTGVLGWANINEGTAVPRPRIKLDMIFTQADLDSEYVIVDDREIEPLSVYEWLEGIHSHLQSSPNGDTERSNARTEPFETMPSSSSNSSWDNLSDIRWGPSFTNDILVEINLPQYGARVVVKTQEGTTGGTEYHRTDSARTQCRHRHGPRHL
ncbi:hypothetical protein F4804DRAFT_309478 [Jackrogersella minutella]|nr:hypothetical protein F4804DRAFT_309478 [Jackrogersella minutella]